MVSWQFQYWNGSGWVNFANAQIDHILEELSSVGGQEELAFALPNTSANRTIVQALPYVQCLFAIFMYVFFFAHYMMLCRKAPRDLTALLTSTRCLSLIPGIITELTLHNMPRSVSISRPRNW